MNAKPISETSSPGCGRFFLFAFGGIFFLVGSVTFVFFFLLPLINTISARSWNEIECTILSSRVESHSSDDGTTYSPEISYEYTVDGRSYQSERVNFVDWSASHSWAKSVVDEHPVGSKKKCFVDPEDPSKAVLNRDFDWTIFLGLFTLIFVAVGAGVLYYAIFRFNKVAKKRALSGSKSSKSPTSVVVRGVNATSNDEFAEWEGPQKLRPASSRLGKFLGITIFMLFWNGFITFFIAMSTKGGGFFGGGFWMYLFFTPFLIAGVIMLFASIHQFLCLWNPVVEIALSNGAIPLGQDVDVAWQLEGRVSRVKRLIVEIVGTERATYTRGTSTYTDEEVFKIIEVVKTDDATQMEFGSESIYIPHDTMHSFEGGNNEVVWSIKVVGEIPWWPDIDESYPFRIKPIQNS